MEKNCYSRESKRKPFINPQLTLIAIECEEIIASSVPYGDGETDENL